MAFELTRTEQVSLAHLVYGDTPNRAASPGGRRLLDCKAPAPDERPDRIASCCSAANFN